ncbi:hypothetical protein BH10PSE12_BH10PSE12_34910 [soil metagenome]
MFRFATLSLIIAAVLAVLGFGGLAGDFAGLALVLFGLAILFSGVFLGLGALESRDMKRVYN